MTKFFLGYLAGIITIIIPLFATAWGKKMQEFDIKQETSDNKVQFVKPITDQERWKNSETVDDFIT